MRIKAKEKLANVKTGKASLESLEKCVLARPLKSEPGKWSHVLLLALFIFYPAWGPSLLLTRTTV